MRPAIAVFSKAMLNVPDLGTFLNALLRDSPAAPDGLAGVAGWGNKPRSLIAKEFARTHGLPFLSVEEGFLCSIGKRQANAPLFSILVDSRRPHYDAATASDLEVALSQADVAEQDLLRARRVQERILKGSLSKYGPGAPCDLGVKTRYRVLIVDQVNADSSIAGGLADAHTFKAMAQYALAKFPDAELIVKSHPAVRGFKRGVLQKKWLPTARWLTGNVDSISLLGQVDEVLVVTSQMGMDALIAGKRVTCFGMPFYAGWGLTIDHQPLPRRARTRSLAELVYLSYVAYPRYVHPVTHQVCDIEHILDHLEMQAAPHRQGQLHYVGFPRWKHPVVRAYLQDATQKGRFSGDMKTALAKGLRAGDTAVVWGHKVAQAQLSLARNAGATVLRMEDGFLRSVGLGSDLIPPSSLVLDTQGIYYDAHCASDLETMLFSHELSPAQRLRTQALVARIVSSKATKYNFKENVKQTQQLTEQLLQKAGGRRIILIPGQVDKDASLLYGAHPEFEFKRMLAEVRALNPDAFLVLRPHPDVLAGNRVASVTGLGPQVDHVEPLMGILPCIALAHEVHCLTSLVGFDALLRGKPVHTWGTPFYAGWGLTTDHAPVRLRNKVLDLDTLAWCALIAYPRYYDWASRSFTTPEATLEQLLYSREAGATPSWRPASVMRKLGRLYSGLKSAWL